MPDPPSSKPAAPTQDAADAGPNPGLRRQLSESGWAHLPGTLPSPLLEQLRGAAERMLGPVLEQSAVAPSTPHVWQLVGPRWRDPTFAEPELDRLAGAAGAALLGCPRVQLLQDVLLFKPPRCTGRIEWHRDQRYLAFLPPSIVTLGVALTDSSDPMGCLEVIDASHRWPSEEDDRILGTDLGQSALDGLSPVHRELVELRRRPLPTRAGDITAHDCRTIHGSGPNPTDQGRMTLLLRLFDARLRPNLDKLATPEARALFVTDGNGALDNERFPLLPGS